MADNEKKLKVTIEGNTSGFQKSMKDASKSTGDLSKALGSIQGQLKGSLEGAAGQLGGFGQVLAALGPAGLTAAGALGAVTAAVGSLVVFVGSAVKELTDFGGALTDLSDRTGLSTDLLQELRFAGSLVGVSMEDAADATTKLQKAIVEGDTVFERLGLNLQRLRELDPGKQFEEVAARIREIKDPAQQTAAAMEAFGKSGSKILPLLKSDLAAAREEAHRLGIVIGSETVAAADDLGDKATKLGAAWEGFKNQIAAVVVDSGVLQESLDTITGLVTELLGPILANKDALAFLFREAAKDAGSLIEKLQILLAAGANIATGGLAGFFGNTLKKAFEDAGKAITEIQAKINAQKAAAPPAPKEGGGGGRTFTAQAEIDKAKKAAQEYQRELEKVTEEERRGAIESNKRWAKEQADIEKVNAGVAKRLSSAEESIFGTSKQAALDAGLAFDDLQTVLARAGKTIGDLNDNELARLEDTLVELEKKTRADAEANNEVAEALGRVRERRREIGTDGFEPQKPIEAALEVTTDWAAELDHVASIFASLGQEDLGRLLGGLSQAVAFASQLKKEFKETGKLSTGSKIGIAEGAIGIGVDAFQGATTNKKTSVGKGVLGGAAKGALIGSVIPGVGTVIGGVVGGIIGGVAGFFGSKAKTKKLFADLNNQLVQQFGSIDKAKEAAKKYGIALDKALSSKKPAELQKAMEALAKATQKEADKIAGLQQAQSAVEQLQDQVANSTNEKLKAAVQQLAGKVSDELLKAGLGFFATGALRGSEQFQGAQGISQATAATVGGLRQAGVVDSSVLEAAGTIATEAQKQAFDAAKAAGLSDAEAQKASFGAISDLLREQLNASLASGKELDANTRALIEEAKKNGIDILADPAIEAVAVAKDQLDVLKQIASGAKGAGQSAKERIAAGVPQFVGGSGGFLNFGSGTLAELHGTEAVIRPQDIMADIPSLGDNIPTFQMRGGEWGDSSIMPVSIGGTQVTLNVAGSVSQDDARRLAEMVGKQVDNGNGRLISALDARYQRR